MRYSLFLVFLISVTCIQSQEYVAAMPDTPVVLGPTPGISTVGHFGRSVARDSRGWIYAVYLRGSWLVRCLRSTDNGCTWSVMADISTEAAILPQLGFGHGDTLHVVWARQQIDSLGMDVFWSMYDGASWTPPLNVSNQHYQNNSMFCSMALDTLGHPHVVWQKGGDIWYSHYDGAVWSPPELATSPAWYLSLASDRRNRLHLIHDTPSYYLCRDSGVWGPPEQFDTSLTGRPSIAVDAFDRPQACWAAVSDSGGDIFYGFRDSSNWTTPVRLGFTRGASRSPSLSEDRWGRKYVVWCDWPDNRDSLTRLYYGNLWWGRYDGVTWRVDSLRYDSLDLDFMPSVGFPVSDSGVDVVWTQGPRFGPYRVMYWRLPLLPSGVETEDQSTLKVEDFKLSVQSPARQVLRVSYALPVQSRVSLVLYDIAGRKVAFLEDGEKLPGRHEVKRPLDLPSGVYFLRLEAGKVDLTRKVVVIR